MPVVYYKRLQMEINLRRSPLPQPELPPGYSWGAWHPRLLDAHARAKFESFRGEIDSQVFASLASYPGCQRLMVEISHHASFVPLATWLIRYDGVPGSEPRPCATIQGLKRSFWRGSIQNVGVAREHRGQGLGRALVLKSLHGFRELGTRRVTLSVTAANTRAVRLYESLGFVLRKTSYRTVEQPVVDE